MSLTGLARYLVVRFAPEAAGSGIQRVEAVEEHEVAPSTRKVLPVKFCGGLLSLGSGMALGREGPTVQMGASIAHYIAPRLVQGKEDERVVLAAGSGAGLAVAFNAPIGGTIFVFEELTRNFTGWLLLCTLGAAGFAITAMRHILGDHFDFNVPFASAPPQNEYRWFLILGALLGMAGAFYNWLIVFLLQYKDRRFKLPTIVHAGFIGGVVGLIGWFSPPLIGGGDTLTQSLFSKTFPLYALAIIFVVRLLLGPLCYSAETPGGMFAPMLFVGSAFGALFGGLAHHYSLATNVPTADFAVIGMAGLFAASVRAPITGMALAIEMTGRADLTLGMMATAFGAVLLAMMLNSAPIYDSLKERMLQRQPKQVLSAVAAGDKS